MSRRALAFTALAIVCVVAAVVSGALAVTGARQDREASEKAVARARPQAKQIIEGNQPFAVFRHVDQSRAERYGRLSVASVGGTKVGEGVIAGPACERVAFAAGRGLCLDLLGTSMSVKVLDARLQVAGSFKLAGIPSRARVSPDGRWGGTTAFVVGHAYAEPGEFSTATTIIDMASGKPVADLEKDITVTRDGKVVDARDRNYWGLTFADDGDTFYATLATGDRTWLIKGSVSERRARTIHENVECPSLSPDGTQIGYKKLVGRDPTVWRFHVLDLATGRETPLSETRSVDDQLAWLDDDHLLYGHDDQTWVVAADGSGEPRVWLKSADSVTIAGGSAAAS